jgi:Ca2+-binding EF-hand superfamily protein
MKCPTPLGILCIVASLVLATAPALAEGQAPPHDPRKAHAEADTNGDGSVDRGEFHARMVEIFFFADTDRDGYITWAELEKAVEFPDDFRDADANADDRISLYEFERVRFDDFDVVDTNRDGLLSVDEVVAVYEAGGVE